MSSEKKESPKDPLRVFDERITRLEQGQDALTKAVAGIDSYFKAPEGLTKQIQDTMLATIPGIIQNEFQEYDKGLQTRFALRTDVKTSNAQSGSSGAPLPLPGNDARGFITDLVTKVTDVLQKMPSGQRVDPNYAEYLAVRDGMMAKALGGLGRGIGRGVEREVAKHIVSFE